MDEYRVIFQKFVIENEQLAALESRFLFLGRRIAEVSQGKAVLQIPAKERDFLHSVIDRVQALSVWGWSTDTVDAAKQSEMDSNEFRQVLGQLRQRPVAGDVTAQLLLHRIFQDANEYVIGFENYRQYRARNAKTAEALTDISAGVQSVMLVARDDIQQNVRQWVNYAVALMIVMVLLTTGGAIVLSRVLRREIVRPVQGLLSTTQIIASGNLDQRAEVVAADEIGDLAMAFNEMADHLRDSRDQLEFRVQERTEELARTNQALVREVAVREETELELARREAHLRTIIDLVPHFIFAKSFDGRFTLANRAVAAAYGTTPEDLVGKFDADFTSNPEELAHFLKSDQAVIQSGVSSYDVEERLTDSAGRSRTLQTTKIPLLGRPDATLPDVLGVSVDITELKEVQAALARAKQDLEAWNASLEERVADSLHKLDASRQSLSAAQNQLVQSETMASLGRMVAVIAHELNTPIGNSRLAASTLQDHVQAFLGKLESGVRKSDLMSLAEAVKKGTQILDFGLHRAAHLISSFKQIAVDQTSSQRRVFSLSSMVDEISVTIEPSIRRAGCTLRWNVPEGVKLDSYPGPLSHVLINLVENAGKHAFIGREPGEILVNCRGAGAQEVVLEVRDDGVGVPEENQKKVFNPFFTTQMGHGGTGLGLSIAYNTVVQILGGTITLESRPGQGAAFVITIPLVAPVIEAPKA